MNNNELYVLKQLVEQFDGQVDFKNTAFLLVQHTQMSTVHLFEALHALGAQYKNMFHLGKIYSEMQTARDAIAKLRDDDNEGKIFFIEHAREPKNLYEEHFDVVFKNAVKKLLSEFCAFLKNEKNSSRNKIDKVIALDDGGALNTMILQGLNSDSHCQILKEYKLGLVEQTTAGTRVIIEQHVEGDDCQKNNRLSVPFIMVSSSYTKSVFEPAFVQEAVVKSASLAFPELEGSKKLHVGVNGFGMIGRAVARGLKALGHIVYVYDISEKVRQSLPELGYTMCNDLATMFKKVSILFGASGKDATEGYEEEILKVIFTENFSVKLASVSSENKEFYKLVNNFFSRKAVSKPLYEEIVGDKLKTIVFNFDQKSVVLCRGGYPINFLPPHFSIPKKKIQVVMGCLLGGIIQANLLANKPNQDVIDPQLHLHTLGAIYQNLSVYHWFRENDELVGNYFASDMEKFNVFSELGESSRYKLTIEEQYRKTYGIDIFNGEKNTNLYQTYEMLPDGVQILEDLGKARRQYRRMIKHIDLGLFLQDKTTMLPSLWNVPDLGSDVIPNNEFYDKLDAQFRDKIDSSDDEIKQCVVCGSSGVGKTTLIANYARKKIEKNVYNHVIWINASSQASLLFQFKHLAFALDVKAKSYEDDPTFTVSRVFELLNGLRQKKVLLVYDTMDHEKIISRVDGPKKYQQYDFCPEEHSSNIHWIRVISGDYNCAPGVMPVIRLNKFSIDQSKDYIYKQLRIKNSDTLIKKLNNFPLALRHASDFIARTGIDIDRYIELYDDEYNKVSDNKVIQGLIKKTIYTTCSILVNYLRNNYLFSLCVMKACIDLNSLVFSFNAIYSRMLDSDLNKIYHALLTLEKFGAINIQHKNETILASNLVNTRDKTININQIVRDYALILLEDFNSESVPSAVHCDIAFEGLSVERVYSAVRSDILHKDLSVKSVPSSVSIDTPQIDGLQYQPMIGDGHCLYRAISYYLSHDEDIQFLRNIVAANLESNVDHYRSFIPLRDDETIGDYIEKIRKTRAWATDVEIRILMELLNRPIVVIGPDLTILNQIYISENQFSGDPIFVYFNNINHYDAFFLDGTQNPRNILENLTQVPGCSQRNGKSFRI